MIVLLFAVYLLQFNVVLIGALRFSRSLNDQQRSQFIDFSRNVSSCDVRVLLLCQFYFICKKKTFFRIRFAEGKRRTDGGICSTKVIYVKWRSGLLFAANIYSLFYKQLNKIVIYTINNVAMDGRETQRSNPSAFEALAVAKMRVNIFFMYINTLHMLQRAHTLLLTGMILAAKKRHQHTDREQKMLLQWSTK